MKYRITTFLRKSIKDNPGSCVLKCLHSLGFPTVSKLRIGKTYYFECDGRKTTLPEKIAKALVNPVMEDYTIEKL